MLFTVTFTYSTLHTQFLLNDVRLIFFCFKQPLCFKLGRIRSSWGSDQITNGYDLISNFGVWTHVQVSLTLAEFLYQTYYVGVLQNLPRFSSTYRESHGSFSLSFHRDFALTHPLFSLVTWLYSFILLHIKLFENSNRWYYVLLSKKLHLQVFPRLYNFVEL